MRKQLFEGRPRAYLRLAKRLVADRSNTCRWQALAVIGEYIPHAAEDVWKVLVAASRNSDDDMRDALATLLLEHLLEYDFDTFFPRVRRSIVDGDSTLLDILGRCYCFVPKRKWRQVERLLSSFRKSRDDEPCIPGMRD